MKKFLMICFIAMFILVGCTTEKPVDEVINYEMISEITDSIDILYSDLENLKFSNKDVISEMENIKELYSQLTETEKNLVENYEDFLEIEKQYELYKEEKAKEEAEKQKIAEAVAETAELVKETVPETTRGEDLELPKKYISKDGIEVFIGWSTDDPLTITNTGVVTQPRVSGKIVRLTAICRSGSESQKVIKDVVVNYLPFEQLPEQPVFAYYYLNQVSLNEMERNTINVINLSFGEIDNDGNVYVTGLKYETILKERKNGIRVCFSVQNKTGFQNWTKTAEAREKLAQSFVDVCIQYHFDGVDIDWEYPVGDEVNNYVEFMKLLYKKMKAKNSNYLVTSAMYGGNGVSKYNAGESYKYMDYIHLMTYDLNDPNLSTHLTSVSGAEKTVDYYVKAGVPKNKLVIGCAFYGKEYKISKDSSSFYYVRPINDPQSINYSEIKNTYLKYIDNPTENITVKREWDSTNRAPYLCVTRYNSDNSVNEKIFITYDDPQSIALKCDVVKSQGLGGIMMWELGSGDRTSNDLIEAIYNSFN